MTQNRIIATLCLVLVLVGVFGGLLAPMPALAQHVACTPPAKEMCWTTNAQTGAFQCTCQVVNYYSGGGVSSSGYSGNCGQQSYYNAAGNVCVPYAVGGGNNYQQNQPTVHGDAYAAGVGTIRNATDAGYWLQVAGGGFVWVTLQAGNAAVTGIVNTVDATGQYAHGVAAGLQGQECRYSWNGYNWVCN